MTGKTNRRNIARYLFVALAAFNGLIALGLGVWTLADTPRVFETFGITYTPEMSALGQSNGGLFVLMALLSFVSIVWLLRGKIEGILVPAAYALFLVVLGIISFASTSSLNVVLIDSIRGFLTVVAAVFAYREMTR
jgi:hypothetical protein